MAIDKIFNDTNVDGIADNIFNSVSNSVSEVKAMQQRKAAENVQLVVESLKKIDTDIRAKFDNVTDVIEKRVLTIQDGRDGINGSDGRDGKDGRNGRDGINGKQGLQGPKGQDGIDGVDGVSVVDAHIDFDGSLIIDLSTGRAINVGEVVAQDIEERIKIITSGGAGGGSGSSGTVTSVAISGGTTGLTTSGGPITTAGTVTLGGTLAVASGGTGTATPSIVAGTNITVTGTWPNQTVTASGGSGSVTSVAATVPAFLSVAGSPITTSGTLAISLSGTALPAANGGTGVANNAAMTVTGSGNFAYTRTLTGTTNVTFPTTGTLATLAGTETLTNKTVDYASNTLTGVVGTTATQTLTNKTIEAGTFTNGYTEEVFTGNSSTAITLDLANGTVQIITLTGNCTYTFPTPVAGKSFTLIHLQDATGSRTVTWPSTVDWPSATAPTLTATALRADKFVFTAISGTSWLGSVAGQNYTV
jgi:hypothetical protein